MVQPLRHAAGDRPRLLHGDRPAGRLAADHARRACAARSGSRSRVTAVWRSSCCSRSGSRESPTAFALFLAAAFTIVAIAAGDLRAASARRRSLAGGEPDRRAGLAADPQPAPLRRLHRPRRARRSPCSGSPPPPASRPAATCGWSPGDVAQVGDYTVTYVEPTSDDRPEQRSLALGAVLAVTPGRRAGDHPRRPRASTSPAPAATRRRRSAASSRASRPARSGATRASPATCGRAMQPDLSSFDAQIDEVDESYARRSTSCRRTLRDDPDVQRPALRRAGAAGPSRSPSAT